MSVALIPDGTKLAARFLREHADVQALIGRRVVVQTPGDTSEPWVRYTQIDAQAISSRVEHLIAYLIQFDCYAGADGGWPEASLLGRTVRALLHDELPGATGLLEDGVVTMVQLVGDSGILDSDFEPARERQILQVQVYAHA